MDSKAKRLEDFEKFAKICFDIGLNGTIADYRKVIEENIELTKLAEDDYSITYSGDIIEDIKRVESVIDNLPFESPIFIKETLDYRGKARKRWIKAIENINAEEKQKAEFISFSMIYIESIIYGHFLESGCYYKAKGVLGVNTVSASKKGKNTLETISLILAGLGGISAKFNEEEQLKKAAILYFLAKRKKDLTSTDDLEEKEKCDLKEIYQKLLKVYENYRDVKTVEEIAIEYIENIENADRVNIIDNIQPKKYVSPNNALANKLTNSDVIDVGKVDVFVGKIKGIETTSYVTIGYDADDKNYNVYKRFTEFERHVSDAIMSIWTECANKGVPCRFTVEMLNNTLIGHKCRLTPKKEAEIDKTIRKFMSLLVDVDATEEAKRLGIIENDDRLTYTENYIYARSVERAKLKKGRKIVKAYELQSEPVLLKYSNKVKQTLIIPAKYLDIDIDMNEQRQSLASNMMRHIAAMKRSSAMDKTILFDTLFESTGLNDASRDKLMDYRKFCFNVLEKWKDKGYIKNYEERKNGKKIEAATVEI